VTEIDDPRIPEVSAEGYARRYSPCSPRERELRELAQAAVRIVARIENERGVVSREGQDFLARARKVLSKP
jgi:hypothetical protein